MKPRLFGKFEVLLASSAILISIYFLMFFPKSQSSRSTKQINSTNQTVSATQNSQLWQVYQNETYGYMLEYPDDWNASVSSYLSPNEIHKVIFSSRDIYSEKVQGSFVLTVYKNPQNLSLDKWVQNYEILLLASPDINLVRIAGPATLSGQAATRLGINTLTVPPNFAVVSAHGKYIFFLESEDWSQMDQNIIDEYHPENAIKTINRILSSFKFLK